MPSDLPLILVPGMGADERMFRAQQAAFPTLRVPRWIASRPGETLAAYAGRLAAVVDPGGLCFVGGASFGGLVALEMAPHLAARAVFLLGSARSPAGLPLALRLARPVARLTLALPFGLLGPLAGLSLRSAGRKSSVSTRSLLRQLTEADATFLRWASRAALDWRPSPAAAAVPIHQLHGARDRVFPARRLTADAVIVPGAGHLLTVTHPAAVNAFLAERMRQVPMPTDRRS